MAIMRLYMAAAPVAQARRRTPAPLVRTGNVFVDDVQPEGKGSKMEAKAA
jgi:hypothetical protein